MNGLSLGLGGPIYGISPMHY